MPNKHASETGEGPHELKTDSAYENLVPAMQEQEFNELKESIRINGQFEPIIVDQDLVVLDGHHRLRACRELDIAPKYEVKIFGSKEVEKAFVIEVNLHRRHLNSFQKIELAYQLEDLEAEKARNRRLRTLRRGRVKPPLGKIFPNGEKGRVAEKCARKAVS